MLDGCVGLDMGRVKLGAAADPMSRSSSYLVFGALYGVESTD